MARYVIKFSLSSTITHQSITVLSCYHTITACMVNRAMLKCDWSGVVILHGSIFPLFGLLKAGLIFEVFEQMEISHSNAWNASVFWSGQCVYSGCQSCFHPRKRLGWWPQCCTVNIRCALCACDLSRFWGQRLGRLPWA